jgi:hypothetical protein
VQSVPTQTPMAENKSDAEVAKYIGLLEGTIAALVINDIKFRTILELLTGEQWDAAQIDPEGKALMDLAVSVLVKQTGMDATNARALVIKRWQDKTSRPVPMPKAVVAEEFSLLNVAERKTNVALEVSMNERYRHWRQRQIAEAEGEPMSQG